MPFPHPEAGLVISYDYLWRYEHRLGKKEGRKTRPCVIILSIEEKEHALYVTVAPVTHVPPADPSLATEIPLKVKRHLGLDDRRSSVILDEVNQFAWPGHDLRPRPGRAVRYEYGFLPPKLFETIKTGILTLFIARRVKASKRD